jgi:hypothetical protein
VPTARAVNRGQAITGRTMFQTPRRRISIALKRYSAT